MASYVHLENKTTFFIIYSHPHPHVAPWISLTISRYILYRHTGCSYVLASRTAFARPCEEVYRNMSLKTTKVSDHFNPLNIIQY